MKVKLIVVYMLNIIDLIATMLLVKRFGIQIEGNPIGTWLIETNLIWFVKIVIVGAALLLLYKFKNNKLAIVGSWITLITFSLLAVYHIFIHLRVCLSMV